MNLSWLKLDVNILNNRKIKIIRKQPGGNDIFTLWIGLLCSAMTSEKAGSVYIADGIPYPDKDLANEYGLELKTVQDGLELFLKYKMIYFDDHGILVIKNFKKYQNIEKIENHREKNRLRQANYRENKRNALLTRDIHKRNDIDKIREDEIRIDKEYIKAVIDYLNSKCNKKFTYSNKQYNKYILSRINEGYNVDDLLKVIDIKLRDDFFCANPKYFAPDTLFRPSNFEKYLNESVVEKEIDGGPKRATEEEREKYKKLKDEGFWEE